MGADAIGAWISAQVSQDKHHDWAVSLAGQVTELLLTCEAVLSEAAFHLQDVSVVLATVREDLVTLTFACNDRLPHPIVVTSCARGRRRGM